MVMGHSGKKLAKRNFAQLPPYLLLVSTKSTRYKSSKASASATHLSDLVYTCDKGRVGSNPRPPLLDEPMAVEDLLGRGKLPRTIVERIERHGVGIGRTGRRHSCCEEGEMIGWERRVVIGEG
jgi:hypothetical protein